MFKSEKLDQIAMSFFVTLFFFLQPGIIFDNPSEEKEKVSLGQTTEFKIGGSTVTVNQMAFGLFGAVLIFWAVVFYGIGIYSFIR